MLARKIVKILHTVAAAGLIGGLAAYMVLLVSVSREDYAAYAHLRGAIDVISGYVLLPSMAVAVVSGLLSMMVHSPFLDKGWVWIKVALGISMFTGVLHIDNAKADYVARLSAEIAAGTAEPGALDRILTGEWGTLIAVMVVSIANVVLAIWRPRRIVSL